MKKSYLYLLLLIPLIPLTYYFFIHRTSSGKFSFEPETKNFQNLKTNLYLRDNLYDYLNGGADSIIEMGFVYLKVWQGNFKEVEFSIELYSFKNREGASKIFENFSKNNEKIHKKYKYEIMEDQGIAFAERYFLKVNTYPADLNFIENNIKIFLEYAYEKKL